MHKRHQPRGVVCTVFCTPSTVSDPSGHVTASQLTHVSELSDAIACYGVARWQVLDEMGNVGAQELPVQELVVFGGWVSVGVSLFQGMALEEMDSGGEFLNDMCALDIDKLEWRRVIPRGTFLPEPRAGHSAVVTGRRMLVFGGQSQYEPLNELLEFQLDLATWRRVQLRGANPSPRSGHSCVMIDQVRGAAHRRALLSPAWAPPCS